MSLYDDSEVDSKGVAGWSSGIKMLQSHVQLRKATGHHLQRKGQAAAAHIAPVLDLNTRTKDVSNWPERNGFQHGQTILAYGNCILDS